MIIFKYAEQLARYIQQQKTAGKQIGFVPTMGALHNGHLALINQSKQATAVTVCSIFVNPTQFNNPSDYQLYPKTIEQDIAKLEAAGCDALFLPAIAEMYPRGTAGLEHYDLGYLETLLEGAFRPGHFQGVCQVMFRLLTMVQPHQLFMGQKDYQQCMVVSRLLTLMQSPIQLVTCPTLREPDGLAMSSRNMRLSAEDRQQATAIYQCLTHIKEQLNQGVSWGVIKEQAEKMLTNAGFRIDYVELANANTLEPASDAQAAASRMPRVALIAAFLHEVRLIDNMLV
ncbi:pantoate--beta-alanine ligase [Niastella yeongjuensis]|uniref:Pantothenate synthetase n=1 Tax=Niastella yeongjuensis TaxID=354355 RepID=A0A1V9F2R0_9BACT|nr:pantoate--beta-alanine ligase [Niastella yeongjuensis]OQP52586.1 pantoate--beta-alanine ligase [Niastella yeongjuensis]SEP34065.1 pantoate--beta-alanine ligase [Niastella yeongjuensis]